MSINCLFNSLFLSLNVESHNDIDLRKMPIAAAASNSLNITEKKNKNGAYKVELMSVIR